MTSVKANSKEALEQLQREAENILATLGYEVVALEQTAAPKSGGRTLTLYIDFPPPENAGSDDRRISLEDCLAANKAVDELFETTPLLDGSYNLDVSSPGVERPLRKARDYARFRGRKVRLHTFRPLEESESENPVYWTKNRKQKNFVGRLEGLTSGGDKVKVSVDGAMVAVPLSLIAKAHLEFTPPDLEG
ncbi:MAG: ribosome maturation factor RimP [Deltaproteobacteria bacterium]|nr:ribosome maturation factor RimP [Deltaproteobacteria bacterium]